jgi:ubiquinone/menaquinone biosynthesis C-methylase UbiE
MGDGTQVGEGFDRAAEDYDDLLRHNREGAARLVGALPAGRYEEILDVGCGTGFVSEEMIARFGTSHVTGVDPSAGMLEQFRAKLAGLSVEATLIQGGVHDMPVPDGAYDAVVSGMAFHWFPEKPAAVAAMARRLRPGGVLGILAAGTGTDEEFRQILEAVDPPVPREWVEVFGLIHRDAAQLRDYMEEAGLVDVDVWEERRVRRVTPEAYMARIDAVASHLSSGLDPDEAAAHGARVAQGVVEASGPLGFEYAFVKLFGIGRRPA